MDFNFEQNQQGNREPVKILGEELERVTHFIYLGTSMEEEGGMETEITKRVGAGWRNWKKCSGVLCDRRMPVKLKGKLHVTIRALVRMRMRFSVNEDRTPLNFIAVYWFGLTDENPVTKQVTFNNDSCNRCALHMMSEPT